jgi:hypothetical protein
VDVVKGKPGAPDTLRKTEYKNHGTIETTYSVLKNEKK